MADQGQDTSKIFTLYVKPGIKRDGTQFEGDEYTDGLWARFQRGRAKKIGGYRQMFASPTGVPRGIITNAQNGVNYIFTGNSKGIEVFNTGTDQGVGVGPFTVEFNTTYVVTAVNTGPSTIEVVGNYTALFVTGFIFWAYNTSRVRTNYTVSATASTYNAGTNRTTVTLTNVTGMPSVPAGQTTMEIYNPNGIAANNNYLWQFDIAYDSTGGGNSKLLAHPGQNLQNIDSGVLTSLYAGDFLPDPTVNRYVLTQVLDSTGANPTYQAINASGGVVVLQPFVFVYSNFGQITNNNIDFTTISTNKQTFSDWNGTLANDVNSAAGKIVKGFPIRGGTASPSGLFWATNALVRVSFTSTAPYYWRYDTVADQISIMSSSAITEMDGVFFWMGVDRFYLYNGSVKVLPNDKNVNYLFDNLNFSQRQKVWATKIPRYNEVWFFYPRGTATECTDAIIYNVKDQIWYDAGQAEGSRRSCGYMTELFPRPIWCDWQFSGSIGQTYTLLYGPSRATAPVTNAKQVIVAGDITTNPPGSYMVFNVNGDPSFATANQIASVAFTNNASGGYTTVTFVNTVPNTVVAGSLMSQATGGYVIWEQEFGSNKITATTEFAIDSYVETCDISFIGGTPAEDTTITSNRRMHLTRVEPDFKQSGAMTMTVVGRPFAQSSDIQYNGPYEFFDDTGKIDLRVEHRLINLIFRSNEVNGDYEAGRIMITAELGDERP
jgi:hypothetical protein